MSDGDPSPEQPKVYASGETDIIVPLIPEALWLALMRATTVDGTVAPLYQFSWGREGDDGEPESVLGQVWLTDDQMQYLTELYSQFHRHYYDGDPA